MSTQAKPRAKFRCGQYVVLAAPWPGPRPGTLPLSEQWESWPEGQVLTIRRVSTAGRPSDLVPRYEVTDGRVSRWIGEELLFDAQLALPF